jgi:hypothetical protein
LSESTAICQSLSSLDCRGALAAFLCWRGDSDVSEAASSIACAAEKLNATQLIASNLCQKDGALFFLMKIDAATITMGSNTPLSEAA